jgi:hypothetical protein
MSKDIKYPITLVVNQHFIAADGTMAIVATEFGNGSFPPHEKTVAQLNETAMLLAPEYVPCSYDQFMRYIISSRAKELGVALAGEVAIPPMKPDQVWWIDLETCGCAEHKAEEPKTDPAFDKALFWKLESDSLDNICECIGSPELYSKGKSAMRDFMLGRISRALGMNWKPTEKPAPEPVPGADEDFTEVNRALDAMTGKPDLCGFKTLAEKENFEADCGKINEPITPDKPAPDYHNSFTGLDADGRAED